MITFPTIKPEFVGDIDNVQYITVQVSDDNFFDVAVDSSSILEYTNNENIWKFNNVTIMRTSVPVHGFHYDGEVYYVNSTEVFRKVNDYYIVILSPKKLLAGTAEYLCTEEPYEVPSVLQYECQSDEKFVADSVTNFKLLDNNIVVPDSYKESLIPNSGAVSYYTKDGYFTAYTKYQTYDVAVQSAISKLIAQNKESLEKYYDDGSVFIAKVFNTYIGVRTINYNTQLVISCKGNEAYPFLISTLYGL